MPSAPAHPPHARALFAPLVAAAFALAVGGPAVAAAAASATPSAALVDSFTITASAGTGGSIAPSGDVRVASGGSQSFFIASDDCYAIDDVLVDGDSQGAVTSYSFFNVLGPHTIEARFKLIPFPIDVVVGSGGSVSPSGTVWVDCGQSRTFTITPDACYMVENVLVDGASIGPVTSYTFVDVQRDHTLEARFAQRAFTIASSAGTGGSIQPAGNVLVACDGARTFTIAPAACYAIQDVTVDGVSQGPVTSYTFTSTHANHSIHADFALLSYPITATADAGGGISPSGTVSAGCGTNVSFDIVADDCHDIGDVVVDGVSKGPLASYTFQSVHAGHSISASFVSAPGSHSIATSAGAGGSIAPGGNVSVPCNGSQTFAIAANACYAIADVRVDGQSVGPVTTYSFSGVVANHTLSATFSFVEDGPPLVNGVAAGPASLWPPDHSMRDVTIDYTASDCSPVGCALTVASNEPSTGTGDGDLGPDVELIDPHHVRLRAERAAAGGGRVYTVTLTCTDAQNHATTTTVRVVSAHDITTPPSGTIAPAGTTLAFSGVFWDVPGNTHQATWTFDAIAVNGSVVEPSGTTNGTSATTCLFPIAGVYGARMSLSDSHGVSSYATTRGDLPEIVAIYDTTTGGYAAGGGWYVSPPGALASNPGATGKMSFGFESSFAKTPNNPRDPRGNLRFTFGQGGLEFRSSSVTAVTISGPRARLTGTGSIVGDPSNYTYLLGVVDGKIAGAGGTHRIRMKIADSGTGAVVYDTQPGAADDAEPTTNAGPGSSIILRYQGAFPAAVGDDAAPRSFSLAPTQPNPVRSIARVRYALPVRSHVALRLYDVSGRCLATLADGEEDAGEKSARLDVGGLAVGVYFCRLEARTPDGSTLLHVETRKLAVAR